jgi:hypothetical protein
MQGIGFTDEISAAELDNLADELTRELSLIDPPTVSFRSLTVHPEAIYLKAHPADALYRLRARMYQAVVSVLGANSTTEDMPAPGNSFRTSALPVSARTVRHNPSRKRCKA